MLIFGGFLFAITGPFLFASHTNTLGIDQQTLYDMTLAKFDVIIERCREGFEKTAEYIAACANQKIIEKYQNAKRSFANKYSVNPDKYDYCFNVFGELMNEAYLDEII